MNPSFKFKSFKFTGTQEGDQEINDFIESVDVQPNGLEMHPSVGIITISYRDKGMEPGPEGIKKYLQKKIRTMIEEITEHHLTKVMIAEQALKLVKEEENATNDSIKQKEDFLASVLLEENLMRDTLKATRELINKIDSGEFTI